MEVLSLRLDKPPNILQRLVSWFKRIGVNESGQSTWKSLGAHFAMSVAVWARILAYSSRNPPPKCAKSLI